LQGEERKTADLSPRGRRERRRVRKKKRSIGSSFTNIAGKGERGKKSAGASEDRMRG